MAFRVFAVLAIVVSTCVQFDLFHRIVGSPDHVYYVSPSGSNWNSGQSRNACFRTIGRAANLVRPGDKIVLLPGVYQERVHLKRGGTAGSPVILEAAEPGQATISWSRPLKEVAFNWTDTGDGIYTSETTTPVYLIREGNRTLFRMQFGGQAGLRNLINRPNAFPAFCQEGHKLFIFLNGRHPDQVPLQSHREVPEPREWGEMKSANLWVESDYIEIRGIRFEFGIGAGVRIWNGQHSVIEDCAFKGCTHGIADRRGRSQAVKVVIEHCLYENFPQHDWSHAWLGWDNIYAHYSTSGLVSSNARELEVAHCAILHCGDAMAVSPDPQSRATIRSNWISGATDDGIELDGDACHVEITGNLIQDCKCSLGLSPVRVGPVSIHHNLMINEPASWSAIFKLLSPWEDALGNIVGIKNIQIEQNVVRGSRLIYWNPTIPAEDLTVKQNVWELSGEQIAWPPGTIESDNILETEFSISKILAQQSTGNRGKSLPDWANSLIQDVLTLPDQCGPRWWSRKNDPARREPVLNSSQSELKAKRAP